MAKKHPLFPVIATSNRLLVIFGLSLIISGCHWIQLVSVGSGGVQGDFPSWGAVLSADGRYVVFTSQATNLVPGDSNERFDVFVFDNLSGTTERVSVSSTGAEADGDSFHIGVSSDARYVAFDSDSTNLVTGDTNGESDIFVHDRQTGLTTRVSVDSQGNQANGFSGGGAISGDGNLVAFSSDATNLVAGDANGSRDVFVHDRTGGQTVMVSVDSSGIQGNDYSSAALSMSQNGRYVVFESSATNLVAGDTNSERDVFLRDMQTGTTSRVSVDSDGNQVNGRSGGGQISNDGNVIAFYSFATDLVQGDTNGWCDVFVHDRATGDTSRVSVDSTGAEGNSASSEYIRPSLSGDGRYIAFGSWADNLVPGDTNGIDDIFMHDRQTSKTTRVTTSALGEESNAWNQSVADISEDGRYIVFASESTNLVPSDNNGYRDIFIKALPVIEIDSLSPSHLAIGASTPVTISGSGFLPDVKPYFNHGTLSNIVIVNETTITADFTVPDTTAAGAYNMGINWMGNPSGPGNLTGVSYTCENCVTLF